MPNPAKKVLVIDDDKVAHAFIAKSLQDEFDVEVAYDGTQGLAKAETWHPQLILLDVEMPGKNGYEVCDLLKNDPLTQDIPIVFLSAKSSLRERLLGYEVGGDDFLVKPIDAEVLQAKAKRFTNTQIERQTLSTQAEDARQTALEAITGSSELGRAIRYVEHTFAISNYDELAASLFSLLAELKLNCCILFNTVDGHRCYAHNKPQATPLEVELMTMLHSDQRFYDFGCRTQVNYTNVAVLIKNMPLDDRVRHGRLKDLLPFVLAATDEKARILDTEHALRTQASHLSRSVQAVKSTLGNIIDSVQDNQNEVEHIIRAMLNELEIKLPIMGLEDDQEAFIINTVDNAFGHVSANMDKNQSLRISLEGVVRLLNYLTEEQNQIVDAAINHNNVRQGDDSDINNIELF